MSFLRSLIDRLLRPLATAAVGWRLRAYRRSGTARPGAHAIALTPDRRVVLVRLRYAGGWRLPGGGREDGETVADGALRELREEIGLIGHGEVTPLPDIDPALVLVEDVDYRPARWSWEVERIVTAAPDALPRGTSPRVRQWIDAARDRI